MAQNEASARIRINQLLEEAGWRFFDNGHGPANILLENHVKITQTEADTWGNDFEKTTTGSLDFLLVDDMKKPVCVLEAKKESIHPLSAKEQARKYANTVGARFIILSNGIVHFLWDLKKGNPSPILKFPSPHEIGAITEWNPDRKALANEKVDIDYIVSIQMPDYKQRPGWNGSVENSKEFIGTHKLTFLRKYQQMAIQHLQKAAAENKDRFLFEMATGTGKTLTSAAVIKLFLRTQNARRVLFLVDRLELEDQAWKAFTRYLKPDYSTFIFKKNKSDWHKADIVVTTIQSLMFNNRYRSDFSRNSYEEGKNQVHTRSLHAEESAFLQITKYGGTGILNGKLFTTASPCELCSKKAYQLGIKVIYYIDPYPGISKEQILKAGSKERNPVIRLFNGAIGNAYHWLYEPFMSYKDELALLLEHNIKDLTKQQKEKIASIEIDLERINKENRMLKQQLAKAKKNINSKKR